jgi:hypothetical protein
MPTTIRKYSFAITGKKRFYNLGRKTADGCKEFGHRKRGATNKF